MVEDITPHNPYPYGFRGDVKKGSYSELDIDGGKSSRFVIIRPKPYFPQETIDREMEFIQKGILTLEDIYPDIARLGYVPERKDTFWLYNVNVCEIDKVYLDESDSEVFAANLKRDEYYTFDDFYKCIDFVEKNFGVGERDFKKDWETNYPQY